MAHNVIYPGTFDPITNGHIDIIERAVKLFDKVIIAIAPTTRKTPYLTLDERMGLMAEVLERFENVKVAKLEGLLVDFAKRHGVKFILRGLRNVSDFDYELQLARMNQRLMSDIDTVFLPASQEVGVISATIVREIAAVGGDIASFVPPLVARYLSEKKNRS